MDWRIQSIDTQEALPTAAGVVFYPAALSPDRRTVPLSRLGATKNSLNPMFKRVSDTLMDRCRTLRSDLASRSIDYTALRIAGWLIRYPAHRRWLRTIGGPTTRSIVRAYPRIKYRPSTSYLYLADDLGAAPPTCWRRTIRLPQPAPLGRLLRPPDRSRRLCAYGAFAKRQHSLRHRDRRPVSCHEAPRRRTRVILFDGRFVLYKISFSIIPAAAILEPEGRSPSPGLMLYVGRVQGSPHAYEAIRTATAACHASTPRDLLMNALFGIADAWGIETIGGVSSERQLSTGCWSEEKLVFNYDRWWEAFEARRSSAGHYMIDLPDRDARYSGRVVSRTRHKKRLKRGLRTAVAEAIVEEFADDRRPC